MYHHGKLPLLVLHLFLLSLTLYKINISILLFTVKKKKNLKWSKKNTKPKSWQK